MTVSSSIRERVKHYGPNGATLSDAEVVGLDDEIDDIVSGIRSAKDCSTAASGLNELGILQELLSLLLFKYDAPLSIKQRAVVRGFDRSDDHDLRLVVYNAVKEGKFP